MDVIETFSDMPGLVKLIVVVLTIWLVARILGWVIAFYIIFTRMLYWKMLAISTRSELEATLNQKNIDYLVSKDKDKDKTTKTV